MSETLAYRLCPQCFRAVPLASKEWYCANDGVRLLEHCPKCRSGITSPYARYCVACGEALSEQTPKTKLKQPAFRKDEHV